jgi:ABC-2 type transport system ATP-binding protein
MRLTGTSFYDPARQPDGGPEFERLIPEAISLLRGESDIPGLESDEVRDRLISGFRLEDKKNALFGSLSGGEKRRVGIVMALVNDPGIVFLDEPTKGLDPWARKDVWNEIKSLKARGKTVFLTTHYMEEAYRLADRICIIHKGRVIAEGSPEEMIREYGGDSTLVVRECSAEALGRLAREMPESRIEGNSLLAKVPGSDGMRGIERAISIMGSDDHACKEIYVKRPTLDDVFINLTGEELTSGGQ